MDIKTKDEKKIKKIKSTIAWVLCFIGLILILSQVFPLSKSYIQGEIETLKQKLLKDPFPDQYRQYISNEFAYYDPGKSYFENLFNSAENLQYQGVFTYDPTSKSNKQIEVNRDYKKNMFISIEKIGIDNIRITPNVESSDEKVYDRYLKFGLAHFKGTPLPGDGGNSFIYGHSAVQSFFNKHSNLPETIFTRLEGVDIGDSVVIKRDNIDIKYLVRNKKIVSPDDFSILKAQGDKETITLMTCWPLGVGTKRLVVVAEKL
ncbi:MAG: sortase [Candidatus Dojkabacteria bacterium]